MLGSLHFLPASKVQLAEKYGRAHFSSSVYLWGKCSKEEPDAFASSTEGN